MKKDTHTMNAPTPDPTVNNPFTLTDSPNAALYAQVASVTSAPFGTSPFPSLDDDFDDADYEDGDYEEDDEDAVSESPDVETDAEPPAPVAPTVASSPDETPTPPKRKRGRPRKVQPTESSAPLTAAEPTDPDQLFRDELSAIKVNNDPSHAWVQLNERRVQAVRESKGVVDAATTVVDAAKQTESALIERTQAALREVHAAQSALKDAEAARIAAEGGLAAAQESVKGAQHRIDQVNRAIAPLETYLTDLAGGGSGRVGAVRVTVIDGKSHVEAL